MRAILPFLVMLFAAVCSGTQNGQSQAQSPFANSKAFFKCSGCDRMHATSGDNPPNAMNQLAAFRCPSNISGEHVWHSITKADYERSSLVILQPEAAQHWLPPALNLTVSLANRKRIGVMLYSHSTVLCFGSSHLVLPSPWILLIAGSVLASIIYFVRSQKLQPEKHNAV